ncbi:methyl-accepting chemotaxis protein [Lysinibacillus piscis]|uniref:Sensory transducer protein YvaQ n=1 Tax=Lysinibacillus piscis TaxID=2518931 RepID=A0ABQ5NG59_9BACI|nr:methyl-accepting chemotaxis protein [Lysinibacillus sp. KH24]GLC87034.1 putative sensory transducer protein YvaQ [Lysinibacillus sp. KH24]
MRLKTIRGKILFIFSIILIGIIIQSSYTVYTSNQMKKELEEMVHEELAISSINQHLANAMSVKMAAVRGYILTGEPLHKEKYQLYKDVAIKEEEKALKLSKSEELATYIAKSNEWNQYIEEKVLPTYEAGDKNTAMIYLVTKDRDARAIQENFETMALEREKSVNKTGESLVKDLRNNNIITVGTVILLIILALSMAFYSATAISSPIRRISKRVQQIADGDLSEENLTIQSRDEIGQLTEATNTMSSKLKDMLQQIQDISNEVAAHSEELSQSANEVKTGTGQVAVTMHEIAEGAESQASHASDLASHMGDFVLRVHEASHNGGEVAKNSDNVLQLTDTGRTLMETSTQQMTKIDGIVHEAVIRVEGLNDKTQEISKLVAVIHSIADQTNLLALNAAIEAARAGEQGKGFAVVADEVRKLAEQVSLSVVDISRIVEQIVGEASNVSNALQSSYGEVKNGTMQIAETSTTFMDIEGAITAMVENIATVSGNLGQIVENSTYINKAVDEIAAISEESAAGVQQTSATIQQTSSTMEEITNSSGQLAKMAENLNQYVKQFKLL